MPQSSAQLDLLLESMLFAAGEPLSVDYMAKITERAPSDVRLALDELSRRLSHGVRLLMNGPNAALVVAPGNEKVISELIGDPEEREIGQAGLEVLAILLYQGPTTRATIDYIRGVNSSSSLRTLLMRSLVERDKADGREIVYRPTLALMEHLGVKDGSELPDAVELKSSLETFTKRQGAPENTENQAQNHGSEPTTTQ